MNAALLFVASGAWPHMMGHAAENELDAQSPVNMSVLHLRGTEANEDDCQWVCARDHCRGTTTNPLPVDEVWESQGRVTNGCCAFGWGDCESCCSWPSGKICKSVPTSANCKGAPTNDIPDGETWTKEALPAYAYDWNCEYIPIPFSNVNSNNSQKEACDICCSA